MSPITTISSLDILSFHHRCIYHDILYHPSSPAPSSFPLLPRHHPQHFLSPEAEQLLINLYSPLTAGLNLFISHRHRCSRLTTN